MPSLYYALIVRDAVRDPEVSPHLRQCSMGRDPGLDQGAEARQAAARRAMRRHQWHVPESVRQPALPHTARRVLRVEEIFAMGKNKQP